MANMSYCRFQNTAQDLRDCLDNWDDDGLSKDELRGMKAILIMMRTLALGVGADFSQSVLDDDLADLDIKIKEASN